MARIFRVGRFRRKADAGSKSRAGSCLDERKQQDDAVRGRCARAAAHGSRCSASSRLCCQVDGRRVSKVQRHKFAARAESENDVYQVRAVSADEGGQASQARATCPREGPQDSKQRLLAISRPASGRAGEQRPWPRSGDGNAYLTPLRRRVAPPRRGPLSPASAASSLPAGTFTP